MKKILVIDDSKLTRDKIKENLIEDYIIVEAKDGLEGIKKYRDGGADLILLDLLMPRMSGLTFLKAIIEMDPGAKVVMCTANIQQDIISKAKDLGALDYIQKPAHVNREKLLSVIKKYI